VLAVPIPIPTSTAPMLTATNLDGYTPLMLAAMHGHLLAVREIVKFSSIVSKDDDFGTVEQQRDPEGNTARDLALKHNHDEIYAFLATK